jgi:hypothetical protein
MLMARGFGCLTTVSTFNFKLQASFSIIFVILKEVYAAFIEQYFWIQQLWMFDAQLAKVKTPLQNLILGATTLLLSHALHFKMARKMNAVHPWCFG